MASNKTPDFVRMSSPIDGKTAAASWHKNGDYFAGAVCSLAGTWV